jgi:hypothetical protein
MRRMAATTLLAAALLAGCGHTDRPEGVVERWLVSLNQGSAGRPDQYAARRVSERILPGWEECDPGALDVIEVGTGSTIPTSIDVGIAHVIPGRPGHLALAPYRVRYASDAADLCGGPLRAAGPTDGFAELFRPTGGEWSVVGLQERQRGDRSLPLPSQGGPPVAEAPRGIWLFSILAGLALCGLVALVMVAMPRPAPVPSEGMDPSEARGL